MDIIKELEDLKSYVAGLARTDMVLTSFPPKHSFASWAGVEDVITKIDLIEDKIKKDATKEQLASSKALVAFVKSYVSAGGPYTDKFIKGLYHYIDMINAEIVLLKNQPLTKFLLKFRENVMKNKLKVK